MRKLNLTAALGLVVLLGLTGCGGKKNKMGGFPRTRHSG